MRKPMPGMSARLDATAPQNHIRELVARLRGNSVPVVQDVPQQVAPAPKPPQWEPNRSVLIRGE